jgi:hypothetical protein
VLKRRLWTAEQVEHLAAANPGMNNRHEWRARQIDSQALLYRNKAARTPDGEARDSYKKLAMVLERTAAKLRIVTTLKEEIQLAKQTPLANAFNCVSVPLHHKLRPLPFRTRFRFASATAASPPPRPAARDRRA